MKNSAWRVRKGTKEYTAFELSLEGMGWRGVEVGSRGNHQRG
jgi:hypothetical protein